MVQPKENLFTPNCIRTFTGKYIDVLNPNPDDINIIDIAHSLAQQCRFGGHTQVFYSVAQHSINCAKRIDKEFALAALLHDASEAYLLDIPRPIKYRLDNYAEIENKLMQVIAEKYNFQYPLPEAVKIVDNIMLDAEWHTIVINYKPADLRNYCSFKDAKQEFLKMFYDLMY